MKIKIQRLGAFLLAGSASFTGVACSGTDHALESQPGTGSSSSSELSYAEDSDPAPVAVTAAGAESQPTSEDVEAGLAPVNVDDPGREARFAAMTSIVGFEMAERIAAFVPNRNVYTLQRTGGTSVTWIEAYPGMVFVTEDGDETHPITLPSLPHSLTAIDIFRTLEPGLVVPVELEQLAARQIEMGSVFAALSAAKADFPNLLPVPDNLSSTYAPPVTPITPITPQHVDAPVAEDAQFGVVTEAAYSSAGCLSPAGGCGSPPFGTEETRTQVTSDSSLNHGHSDENREIMGIACAQAGAIVFKLRVDCGFWCSQLTLFNQTLTQGQVRGVYTVKYEDFDEFWYSSDLRDFQAGDKGAHCVSSWGV